MERTIREGERVWLEIEIKKISKKWSEKMERQKHRIRSVLRK